VGSLTRGAGRRVVRDGARGPRRTPHLRWTATAAVCAGVLALTSCGPFGSDGDAAPTRHAKGDAVRVGLLLPERETARYEKFDRPVFTQQVDELTHGKGTVLYANAEQSATRQEKQLDDMVGRVDTIVVDAVDAKSLAPAVRRAKDAGVNVLAYDRLAEGPVDGYVTFDGELVGQVQGRALRDALKDRPADDRTIVMMNGAPTDPNAALFKRGALGELQNEVTIGKSYDTADWKPENARANMAAALKQLGAGHVAGVYSANDGMAGGVIEALKDAGLTDLPPVTGQDAELSAVRRIVTGEQYMSVYKPYRQEAAAAAEMAVKISQGRMIEFDALALDRSRNATVPKIPSHLVPVRPLTRGSIRSTVVKDRIFSVDDICTAAYEAACRSVGLEH
jgi:D-xylose transport system substrate-binding protein